MTSKNIVFFTKTNWSEPPRIRHQMARLLQAKGYYIHFFEKPNYKSFFPKKRQEECINLYSHSELIHHQLRYFPIIQKLNSWFTKTYIKRLLKDTEFDYVLNFNYDYTFLRKLFPNKKIITLINDDFENMARFGMKEQILKQTKKTCELSDFVLTVSYPLFNKLESYNKNIELLLPWSQNKYSKPKATLKRDTVLYFGFVGRLDWEKLDAVIKEGKYNYRFIGPCVGNLAEQKMRRFESLYPNFEYIKFASLDDLRYKSQDVFCSILPYDANNEGIQSCTLSNRALNLLSFGLPLVYADLKHLIKAPKTIIRKNISVKDYQNSLDFFYENYDATQPDIDNFMQSHYSENRWEIINKIFSI